MPRLLIIGYGNPLRGDDAVGFLAAERLQRLVQDPEIEILAVHQLTPELMESLSRADRAIFMDAAADGEPGAISVTRIDDGAASNLAFTHFANPDALLAGVRTIYGRSPAASLIRIGGRDFGIGESLSRSVQLALEDLVMLAMDNIHHAANAVVP